jgi:hypothetical protein
VRKPLIAQDNFITAQGRTNPDENTGISIHNCKILTASDLAPVKSDPIEGPNPISIPYQFGSIE